MKKISLILFCFISLTIAVKAQSNVSGKESYLSWTASQAEKIGKSMRVKGRVGDWDLRLLKTNRSINYKLRATLLTPEVIRATARLEQLRNRLTDEQTQKLVSEAEDTDGIVVMVEIDPREGSGVIPLDWRVFLQPRGLQADSPGAVAGVKSPQLRDVKAFSGVRRRDYDFDVFWVVFPLFDENNKPLFAKTLSHLELFVGIYNREGRVVWEMPESIRMKLSASTEK